MPKLRLRIQCTERTCRRRFQIEVRGEYSGRRMRIECPGCFSKYTIRIPLIPNPTPPSQEPDTPDGANPSFGELVDTVLSTLEIDVTEISRNFKKKVVGEDK